MKYLSLILPYLVLFHFSELCDCLSHFKLNFEDVKSEELHKKIKTDLRFLGERKLPD